MFKIPLFSKSQREYSIKPLVLLVLDGFGIAPPSHGNAIAQANTPNLDYYSQNYVYGQLIASGESVGLPANEAGNSEVGHLTIGAGRTIDQSLVRINKSIQDFSFFDNEAFLKAVDHTRQNNSKLHIMGLASEGSVHSALNHLYALIELCDKQNLTGVCFHLFTDGRDAAPTEGLAVITSIEKKLTDSTIGSICTISGRYYAMDRDARWDRTKLMYDAMVLGKGPIASSATQAVKSSYDKAITDEFIVPTVIQKDTKKLVEDGDSVIFFNFRIDRPRQLTMAFVLPDFEKLKHVEFGYTPHSQKLGKSKETKSNSPTFTREKWPQNLYFVTMTEYQKNLPVSDVAFPPPVVDGTLAEAVSRAGLKQFRLAESEKERMVTFYFDGLKDARFPGEEVKIVPSPNVPTYDKKPEMNIRGIVREFKNFLKKDQYHLFVMNFANPDMVAHSGNIDATEVALKAVDKAVGEVVLETLKRDGTVVITSDHGNAEELLTFRRESFYYTSDKGKVNTEHSNNPVPVYIISNTLKTSTVGQKGQQIKFNVNGALEDVAPTILSIMGFEKTKQMTGRNLLDPGIRDKNKLNPTYDT